MKSGGRGRRDFRYGRERECVRLELREVSVVRYWLGRRQPI